MKLKQTSRNIKMAGMNAESGHRHRPGHSTISRSRTDHRMGVRNLGDSRFKVEVAGRSWRDKQRCLPGSSLHLVYYLGTQRAGPIVAGNDAVMITIPYRNFNGPCRTQGTQLTDSSLEAVYTSLLEHDPCRIPFAGSNESPAYTPLL